MTAEEKRIEHRKALDAKRIPVRIDDRTVILVDPKKAKEAADNFRNKVQQAYINATKSNRGNDFFKQN